MAGWNLIESITCPDIDRSIKSAGAHLAEDFSLAGLSCFPWISSARARHLLDASKKMFKLSSRRWRGVQPTRKIDRKRRWLSIIITPCLFYVLFYLFPFLNFRLIPLLMCFFFPFFGRFFIFPGGCFMCFYCAVVMGSQQNSTKVSQKLETKSTTNGPTGDGCNRLQ